MVAAVPIRGKFILYFSLFSTFDLSKVGAQKLTNFFLFLISDFVT